MRVHSNQILPGLTAALTVLGASFGFAKDTVTMGASVSPEMLLPIMVAASKGCFASNNIELKMRMLGGPATRDALMAGEINFAAFHVAPVWIAVAKGLPFRFVSMYYNKEIFGVIASEKLKSSVNSMQDLKGLPGLTSTPGSASYAAASFFLKKSGLDISKDVQITYLASTDPKIWLNSIETGKVSYEAGVWEPTFTTAVRKGMAFSIFDPADAAQHARMYGGDVSTLGVVTTQDMIKSSPGVVKRFIRCIDVGLSEIPKASEKSLVDAMRSGGIALDPDDLSAVIQRIRNNFEATGKPSKSKYERAVSAYRQAGYLKMNMPFEDVVDTSILGAAP